MTMFNRCLHLNLSQICSHFTNDCQLCLASTKDLMVGLRKTPANKHPKKPKTKKRKKNHA